MEQIPSATPYTTDLNNTTTQTTDKDEKKTNKQAGTQNDDIHTVVMEVASEHIGIVMGKEGRSQRKVERRTHTRIHISTDRNANRTQNITIRGGKKQTEEAKQDITDLLRTTTRERPQSRDPPKPTTRERQRTTCRYYKQGNCIKGRNCDYEHDDRQDRKRNRSQSSNRSTHRDEYNKKYPRT